MNTECVMAFLILMKLGVNQNKQRHETVKEKSLLSWLQSRSGPRDYYVLANLQKRMLKERRFGFWEFEQSFVYNWCNASILLKETIAVEKLEFYKKNLFTFT